MGTTFNASLFLEAPEQTDPELGIARIEIGSLIDAADALLDLMAAQRHDMIQGSTEGPLACDEQWGWWKTYLNAAYLARLALAIQACVDKDNKIKAREKAEPKDAPLTACSA